MKRILYSLSVLFLFSCQKSLVESPKSIAVETFYNSPGEMDAAVAAIYSPLRDDNCFGAYYLGLEECNDECISCRGSWIPTSQYQGYNATNILRTGNAWNDFYLSIRNANLVIKNTPNGTDLTDEQKNQYIGEARFLRGLVYFQLVRNWAGVPLRTDSNMDVRDVPRSSIDEVYQLITSDLQFAENNLPDAVSVPGHPSKWSAKTVLADVYFYQGLDAQAASKAQEVIQANKYSLVPVTSADDFENLYGSSVVTTPEEIFYLKYSSLSGWTWSSWANAPTPSPYSYTIGLYLYSSWDTSSVYENWDNNDLRKQYIWYSWNTPLGNILLSKKFADRVDPQAANDYPWYRYADLLLIYAEASCVAAGGPTADGVEKLNMVHRRAYGYDPLQPSPVDFQLADYDEQSFADLVVKERGYETQIEGKRWLDLKRTGKVKEYILAARGIVVADKHLLWPIPASELATNKALDPSKDQNPGY